MIKILLPNSHFRLLTFFIHTGFTLKQLIHIFAFLVMTITIANTYGMKGNAHHNSAFPFSGLPNELWLDIITLSSQDGEVHQDSDAVEQAIITLQTIRRVLPLKLVCKRLCEVGSMAINDLLFRAEEGMKEFGGKNEVLGRAINSEKEAVARLCLGLGSNINAINYTQDVVVSARSMKKETLLTRAIKEASVDQIRLILKLGADPMQPNAYGDVPIDLAFDITGKKLACELKDNGGDQENRYRYTGDEVWLSGDQYGRVYGLKRLEQQSYENSLFLKYVWHKPWVMFGAGVAASGVCYCAHTLWKVYKKRKRKQQLQVNWEQFQQEVQRESASSLRSSSYV